MGFTMKTNNFTSNGGSYNTGFLDLYCNAIYLNNVEINVSEMVVAALSVKPQDVKIDITGKNDINIEHLLVQKGIEFDAELFGNPNDIFVFSNSEELQQKINEINDIEPEVAQTNDAKEMSWSEWFGFDKCPFGHGSSDVDADAV